MNRVITILCLIFGLASAQAQTTNPNTLVNIPKASQTEIDAYDINALEVGMLVYNTDTNRNLVYTDAGFLELLTSKSTYSSSFIITANGEQIVTGLPFRPSSITMSARPNIETLTIDADNEVGNNNTGIPNTFGTMSGYARQDGANIIQQVIYVGGSGNSINDISRYSSPFNCIGIRYSNINGDSLGKTVASLSEFTSDGFKINVSEKADNLAVIFTAYK